MIALRIIVTRQPHARRVPRPKAVQDLMLPCSPKLTESIVHEEIEGVAVTGNCEFVLRVVQLVQAFQSDGIEIACGRVRTQVLELAGTRPTPNCLQAAWSAPTSEGRVLGQDRGVPRNERVDERHVGRRCAEAGLDCVFVCVCLRGPALQCKLLWLAAAVANRPVNAARA